MKDDITSVHCLCHYAGEHYHKSKLDCCCLKQTYIRMCMLQNFLRWPLYCVPPYQQAL